MLVETVESDHSHSCKYRKEKVLHNIRVLAQKKREGGKNTVKLTVAFWYAVKT